MKLSVIVPIYNVQEYITECAQSLFKQSYDDYEIIFVDDGCKDQSISILERLILENKISNCRIIHKENEGLPQARKTGFEHSCGEYITFVDSDDWISADYLKNAMTYVIDTNLTLYNLGYHEYYSSNRVAEKCKVNEFRVVGLAEYISLIHKRSLFHTMWSKIIRRDVLEKYFVFPTGNFVYEDYITLIPSVREISNVGLIPETGYFYRYRINSMANSCYSNSKKIGFEYLTRYYSKIVSWYPDDIKSIDVFYSIEYMATIIAMGKSNTFDNEKICLIQNFLKKKYVSVLKSRDTDLKFKLSIIPMMVCPKIFSILYSKVIFKG